MTRFHQNICPIFDFAPKKQFILPNFRRFRQYYSSTSTAGSVIRDPIPFDANPTGLEKYPPVGGEEVNQKVDVSFVIRRYDGLISESATALIV
jgi:hypothetical protein